MIKYINKFIINEDIEKVWEFYTDIRHLEIITPKKLNLKIIYTTNQKIILGQEIVISAKIMAIKRTWRSKITFFQQYEYIDEMLEGPFIKWKHVHKFSRISNNKTEIIDEVELVLPYGVFGKVMSIYVIKILRQLFEHRNDETSKYFNQMKLNH